MKIKMLTAIAGPGISLGIGEETEAFSDAEAARMIEKGMAVAVAAPAPKKRAPKKKESADG